MWKHKVCGCTDCCFRENLRGQELDLLILMLKEKKLEADDLFGEHTEEIVSMDLSHNSDFKARSCNLSDFKTRYCGLDNLSMSTQDKMCL